MWQAGDEKGGRELLLNGEVPGGEAGVEGGQEINSEKEIQIKN